MYTCCWYRFLDGAPSIPLKFGSSYDSGCGTWVRFKCIAVDPVSAITHATTNASTTQQEQCEVVQTRDHHLTQGANFFRRESLRRLHIRARTMRIRKIPKGHLMPRGPHVVWFTYTSHARRFLSSPGPTTISIIITIISIVILKAS